MVNSQEGKKAMKSCRSLRMGRFVFAILLTLAGVFALPINSSAWPGAHKTLQCTDCHLVMPDAQVDTIDTVTFVNSNPEELCLSCHEGMRESGSYDAPMMMFAAAAATSTNFKHKSSAIVPQSMYSHYLQWIAENGGNYNPPLTANALRMYPSGSGYSYSCNACHVGMGGGYPPIPMTNMELCIVCHGGQGNADRSGADPRFSSSPRVLYNPTHLGVTDGYSEYPPPSGAPTSGSAVGGAIPLPLAVAKSFHTSVQENLAYRIEIDFFGDGTVEQVVTEFPERTSPFAPTRWYTGEPPRWPNEMVLHREDTSTWPAGSHVLKIIPYDPLNNIDGNAYALNLVKADSWFEPSVGSVNFFGDDTTTAFAGGFEIFDLAFSAVTSNPAWTPVSARPVGYVRGGNMTVQADLTAARTIAAGESVLVRVTPVGTLTGTNPSGALEVLPLAFDPSSRDIAVTDWGASDSSVLSFTSVLPADAVRQVTLDVAWEISESRDNGNTWHSSLISGHTNNIVFLTYGPPLANNAAPGENPAVGQPWSVTLALATAWAYGTATDSDVLRSLTAKAHTENGHVYDGDEHSSVEPDRRAQTQTFKYPRFLFTDPNADCRDMSNFLVVLSRSLGLDAEHRRLFAGTDPNFPTPFYTNYIGPVGGRQDANIDFANSPALSYTDNNGGAGFAWIQTGWNYHQIVKYGGLFSDADLRFDAQPLTPVNPEPILNQRDISHDESVSRHLEAYYIDPGSYVPRQPDNPVGLTLDAYKGILVYRDAPFAWGDPKLYEDPGVQYIPYVSTQVTM